MGIYCRSLEFGGGRLVGGLLLNTGRLRLGATC